MPIVLYMTPLSPPARAVQLTAAALGLQLELKNVDLVKQEQLKPEFVKVNNFNVIFLLCESLVVTSYV